MKRPACIYCGKYASVHEDGVCAKCQEDLNRCRERMRGMCIDAPCLTPNSCALARRCKGIELNACNTPNKSAIEWTPTLNA